MSQKRQRPKDPFEMLGFRTPDLTRLSRNVAEMKRIASHISQGDEGEGSGGRDHAGINAEESPHRHSFERAATAAAEFLEAQGHFLGDIDDTDLSLTDATAIENGWRFTYSDHKGQRPCLEVDVSRDGRILGLRNIRRS